MASSKKSIGPWPDTTIELDLEKAKFETWITRRRSGLGGTDAAALLGNNPYKSVTTLFAEKTTSDKIVETAPTSEAAYFGQRLESFVAREFSDRSGLPAQKANVMLRSIRWPWMFATLDYMVYQPSQTDNVTPIIGPDGSVMSYVEVKSPETFLECKTTAWYLGRQWKAGTVPVYAETQVLHYLAVTNRPHCWLACLVGGQAFFWLKIEQDPVISEKLAEIEGRFWEYVETRRLPPDPFVMNGRLRAHQFDPDELAKVVALDDNMVRRIDAYWKAVDARGKMDILIHQLEEEFTGYMYGAEIGVGLRKELLRMEGPRGSKRLLVNRPYPPEQVGVG